MKKNGPESTTVAATLECEERVCPRLDPRPLKLTQKTDNGNLNPGRLKF
jgi:hypothetical protein